MPAAEALTYSQLQHGEIFTNRNVFADIGLRSYGIHFDKLSPDAVQAMKTNIASDDTWKLIDNTSTGFVCKRAGQTIAMSFLVSSGNPWRFFDKDWSYIRMLGVLPEYRGQGIGKKLTNICLDLARQRGEKTIALHTSDFMDDARHIYESMGFKILREVDSNYGRKYWLYTMALTE
jgi:ribosomal protein S18 acetylase RimI-like enzyme